MGLTLHRTWHFYFFKDFTGLGISRLSILTVVLIIAPDRVHVWRVNVSLVSRQINITANSTKQIVWRVMSWHCWAFHLLLFSTFHQWGKLGRFRLDRPDMKPNNLCNNVKKTQETMARLCTNICFLQIDTNAQDTDTKTWTAKCWPCAPSLNGTSLGRRSTNKYKHATATHLSGGMNNKNSSLSIEKYFSSILTWEKRNKRRV